MTKQQLEKCLIRNLSTIEMADLLERLGGHVNPTPILNDILRYHDAEKVIEQLKRMGYPMDEK